MTVDPTAILSEGLARLEELRVEHLSALEGVHAAKARAEATVAEAKKDTDVIVDEAKARARDIIDAAKSEAEMILDEAKSRASEVMDAAKSEAGVIVGDTKRHVVRERSAHEPWTLGNVREQARRMLSEHAGVFTANPH